MATRTISVTVPPLHTLQREVFDHPARFKVLVAGRRFGKSRLAATVSASQLLKGKNVWWVAPTFDISKRVGWRMMCALFNPLVRAGYAEINKSDLIITLRNGGLFQAKSASDPSKLVGEGLDDVIIDEAGIVPENALIESLRPALSDKLGRALFIGTPKGRNWFWQAYMLGQNPDNADWKSWRVSSAGNPYMPPGELETARALLPQRVFEQEYLAEFLDDAGAVFRNINAACTVERREAPEPGHSYLFGVDWARDNDFTVIAVMDRDTRQLVHLDRFNSIGWTLQRGRLAALYEVWSPDLIWAEENSIGGPNIEALQNEGLPVQPFMTTAQSKSPLIESLALAFEKGEIGIMNDPVLVSELQAYTFDRLPSGRFAYSAPPGLHDDCVIALALAWHGASSAGIGIY